MGDSGGRTTTFREEGRLQSVRQEASCSEIIISLMDKRTRLRWNTCPFLGCEGTFAVRGSILVQEGWVTKILSETGEFMKTIP